MADKVRNYIREDIGDGKYCIIVDESRDESKREQMAIVLRFVDALGFIRERFLDLVYVPDTKSLSLKLHICELLSLHKLDIKNMRGQGYDGASNMRGEWNGLQALILQECPFAYYVHCFAHRLQLALVAAASDVISVNQFFENVTYIVNVVTSSSKRHDQLLDAQADLIAELISTGELETGKGKNQVGTLKRHGDTRWSSHLNSLRSLIKMYDATCLALKDIINDKSCKSRQRSEADGVYDKITSFEFIFILHTMIETLEITDYLCQTLQRKSQDIENAMNLVSSTKIQLQELREEGWVTLIEKVKLFCDKREIEFPDMQQTYKLGRGRGRLTDISVEHHLRVDLFSECIDFQLLEFQSSFSENVTELLMLTSALNPRDGFKLFDVDDICKLASKFYPTNFTECELSHLKYELNHFKIYSRTNNELQEVSNVPELCRVLQETKKSEIFPLFDRLIRLVLTLPVSTATTERAFSAMKIVKTRLRNKMEDDFLADSLVTYIEKDIARGFDVDSSIDAFDLKKKRRVPLQISSKKI